MGHELFVGMSQSGKTTLAQEMAKSYLIAGMPVGVLDISLDENWPQPAFVSDDVEKFLDWYWKSIRCAVFFDEAGESLNRFDKATNATATRGRKWGHINHYITQRGAQLSPVIRGQCSEIFLFCSDAKVCEIYADEFVEPRLKAGHTLDQGEFFHVKRFAAIGSGRFFERGRLTISD